MDFEALLGRKLKDNDVVEVLENFDMTVIYEFDRTHEGMDDLYWSGAHSDGFQFGFDKDQVLYVVFLYITPAEGFDSIDPADIGLRIFNSFDEAKASFESSGVPHRESPGEKWWIKGDFGKSTRHYQFHDGALFRVTLSLKRDA